MTTTPIRLQTQIGSDTFFLLKEQEEHYKSIGCHTQFKMRCDSDYKHAERLLGNWLDDDGASARLDDSNPEAWNFYRAVSDVCSALLYFSRKQA